MQALPVHVKALEGQRLLQVAAGYHHTLFLSEKGELSSCGQGEMGQLGLRSFESVATPHKVQLVSQSTTRGRKGTSGHDR